MDHVQQLRKDVPERVLDGAARLFRVKGYDGTSTREIAAAVGITKATLYHYIDSKDDLLFELSVASLESVHTAVSRAVAEERDPLSRLRAAIAAHLDSMLMHRDMHATMLMSLRSLSGDRAAYVTSLRDGYENLLRNLVQEGQERGVIASVASPKYIVLAILNLLNWTMFWYEPTGDLSPSDLAQLFEGILLHGIAVDAKAHSLYGNGSTL